MKNYNLVWNMTIQFGIFEKQGFKNLQFSLEYLKFTKKCNYNLVWNKRRFVPEIKF